MIIYPTIELKNGRCVSLHRGRLAEPVEWDIDPLEAAHSFAAAGAEWMHLTDFDAIEGDTGNAALIERIIRHAGIPVQLAGGFRSRERVEQWIDRGAGRIVIATLATQDPHLVKALVEHHPDQIVLAIDIWQGKLMCDGWTRAASIAPETLIAAFEHSALAGLLVTDIDSDVEQQDAHLGVISGIAAKTRHPVVASGTVHGPDDIARLKYIHNIAGTLVGRALATGKLTLEEALAEARPTHEKTAEFQ